MIMDRRRKAKYETEEREDEQEEEEEEEFDVLCHAKYIMYTYNKKLLFFCQCV